MSYQFICRTLNQIKLPKIFLTLDKNEIGVKVRFPGTTLGIRMLFTIKRKKVVRPLAKEIDSFISSRRSNGREFSTAQEHREFIEHFIDISGVKSVEDIDERSIIAYLEGIRDTERTEYRRLTAAVAIRQFMAFIDRKEIKKLQGRVGRPPKTERNMEMIALRKFDPKQWTVQALADKFKITKRAVWEILDRHKDLLGK